MTVDGGSLAPRQRDREAPFALGDVPRSWGDLLSDAATLAAALPPGLRGELMVACNDRYLCAVTLLATWAVGCVAALPPNSRQETIDELCAAQGIPLVLHDGGGSGGLDVRPLLTAPARGRAAVAPLAPPSFAPEQPVVCVYTSGSTGAHVACRKTAAQLLGEARLLVDLFELGPGTRLLATVPPHHIYGLLFGVLVPFMGGGAFARSTPHHAETIAAQARALGANVLCSVPAHLRGLGAVGKGALPPLRRIFSSGAPLDPATAAEVEALADTPVTEVLGSSETGGIAWRTSGGRGLWRPFPPVRVTAGAGGLMLVESPFAGETPHQGADRIEPAGDGTFTLVGRADGIVKIGGGRIAVAEVERLLRELPSVRDAAVVSVAVGGARQHELWAAVVAPGATVPELRAALLRRLEPIALPRRFRLVDALPREDNGKLQRQRLLALFDTTAAGAPARHRVARAVPADSPFFRGHFDGYPVLPGVVQLNELVLAEVRARWPSLGGLRRVVGLKFRRPIAPDQPLVIELAQTAPAKVSFEIRRDGAAGDVVSSGLLVFQAAGAAAEGARS